MKYNLRLTVISILLLLSSVYLPVWAQNARIQGKDSPHPVSTVSLTDSITAVYDSIETDTRKAGDVAKQGLARHNCLRALSNKRLYEEIIRQAPATLDFLSEKELWKDYYQSYMVLMDAYRRTGAYEKALAEADRVYEHAKKRDDRAGMGISLHAVSRIYTAQRRFPEAEKCLRESIEMMSDQTTYLNILATAYNHLASCLIAQERYDEALQVAHDTEEVNRRYEQSSQAPRPSAWYNLWLIYIDIYRQTEEYDKAQLYINKADSITKGRVRQYKEQGHVFYGQKRYPEALEMLDKAIAAHPNSLEPKALKLMTLTQMREPEKAVELFSDVIAQMEERHNKEYNARLDEIRTQYEVDKYIAEKERNLHYFLFALGGCLLLALLLGGVFYYNRLILAKNRRLYLQIKEQDRLEEEITRLQAQTAFHESTTHKEDNEDKGNNTDKENSTNPNTEPKSATQPKGDSTPSLPGSPQQRELVASLRKYLLCDNYLSNTEDINRDEIASALGTNKNILTEAVKSVTGKTPMEYIRLVQLEEARHLLDKHPELTIEAIASDCGFNATNTFYRLFRKHYGISPMEYRKIAASLEA